MNKTSFLMILAIALSVLMMVPAGSAARAGFVGTTSCNGSTQVCSYSLSGIHYTDVIAVPEVGIGYFYVDGLTLGTCVFAAVSCVSGTYAETLTAGQTGAYLVAYSDSLLGTDDSESRQVQNPY